MKNPEKIQSRIDDTREYIKILEARIVEYGQKILSAAKDINEYGEGVNWIQQYIKSQENFRVEIREHSAYIKALEWVLEK